MSDSLIAGKELSLQISYDPFSQNSGFCIYGGCFFRLPRIAASFEYDPVIAQVGDKKLRQSDVQSNFSSLMTEEDSLSVLELYVDKWVTKELKLRAAESMFRDSESDIEAMVNEYRNSLLMRKLDQYSSTMSWIQPSPTVR